MASVFGYSCAPCRCEVPHLQCTAGPVHTVSLVRLMMDGFGLGVLSVPSRCPCALPCMQAQVASYDAEPLPSAVAVAAAAVLPTDSWVTRMQAEAEATGAQRREMAARLVQGELRIWKAAQAWLTKAGGKQHAPRRGAGAAGASSQREKRKR